jgi:type IV pilus assembly protein PilE
VKKPNGFTLIELMIVVAVIGVLAVIAIPSYLSQTRKARRSEVEGAIQQVALLEERYRADCTTYANFGDTCTGTSITFPAWTSLYTNVYYSTPTVTANGSGYKIVITAKSTGGQSKDSASGTSCATLTYDYYTTPGTLSQTPAACWSK